MQASLPKKSELPKIWGGLQPPPAPPARTPMNVTALGQGHDILRDAICGFSYTKQGSSTYKHRIYPAPVLVV